MLKKIYHWLITLFKPTKPIELPKQSNTTDILQAATTELVTRPQQEKEDRHFKHSNNIIDQFVDDYPTLITRMGVYYKEGDPRNTYNPNKKRYVEDYNGRILEIGGSMNGTWEGKTPKEDDIDDMPDNSDMLEYINKLRKEWQEKQKVFNYVDHLRQNPMTPKEAFNKPDNKSTDHD